MSDQATTPSTNDTPLTAEQAKDVWAQELATRDGEAPDTSAASNTLPTETAQETETSKTVETPAQAATPDPLAQQIAAAMAPLQAELSRMNGRVAAMQSATDKAKATGNAAPTTAQQTAALQDPDEWKQLLEDFPEWGTAVGKKIAAEIAHLKAATEASQQQVPDVTTIVNTALAKREHDRVDRLHPGWRETVKTPAFDTWAKAQTAEVQALANSDLSDDADKLLRLFKESTATTTASTITARRAATQQAAAVTGRPNQPKGAQSVAGDESPEALWDAEVKRRQRKRAA